MQISSVVHIEQGNLLYLYKFDAILCNYIVNKIIVYRKHAFTIPADRKELHNENSWCVFIIDVCLEWLDRRYIDNLSLEGIYRYLIDLWLDECLVCFC